MDDRKKNRIWHYCKLLRLPAWDTKDLLQYISIYFDAPCSVEFISIKTEILKLDIMNVAERLIEYLEIEERNFREYKAQYSDTPDDMIWLKVYQKMDDFCKLEIREAKQHTINNSINWQMIGFIASIIIWILFISIGQDINGTWYAGILYASFFLFGIFYLPVYIIIWIVKIFRNQ